MKTFILKRLFSVFFAIASLTSFQVEASFLGGNLPDGSPEGVDVYYDTDQNLTWLADTNYQGTKSWQYADDWVQTLSIGGYEDWRLPTVDEIRQIWVTELGNYQYALGSPNPNTYNAGPFRNIRYFADRFNTSGVLEQAAYWTSDTNGDFAYAWKTYSGLVINQYKDNYGYSTWLVRSGDSGLSNAPVPLPATWLLFLGGLGWLRLRSK